MLYSLEFILKESALKEEISDTLIENNVLEILVSLFRLMGIKERKSVKKVNENTEISLAKQYIDDNIYQINSVSDVAVYCHFSTKQLTRLFKRFEDIAPANT